MKALEAKEAAKSKPADAPKTPASVAKKTTPAKPPPATTPRTTGGKTMGGRGRPGPVCVSVCLMGEKRLYGRACAVKFIHEGAPVLRARKTKKLPTECTCAIDHRGRDRGKASLGKHLIVRSGTELRPNGAIIF